MYLEKYQKWLISHELKKESTAKQYKAAITKLMQHYKEYKGLTLDFFTTSIEKLEEIENLYKKGGVFSDFGSKSNWTNSNALSALIRYRNNFDSISYFNLKDLQNYSNFVSKNYSENPEGKQYFDRLRNNLKNIVYLFNQQSELELLNNYNEKPNQQAGKGKGFKYKEYILAGFIPIILYDFFGDNVFIKFILCDFVNKPKLGIEIDVNFSKKKENPFLDQRTMFQEYNWIIDIDENFPTNWNELLLKINPKILELTEKLKDFSSIIEGKKQEEKMLSNTNLNQILFGPPGTGKTYNTINKAIAIANPNFDLKEDRDIVKQEYDRLVKEGQIVFTTFHQSMAYEDFVEGIKPEATENGRVVYKVETGIFMNSCARAAYNSYQKYKQNQQSSEYSFEQLYEAFIEKIRNQLQNNIKPVFTSITGFETEIYKINSRNSIKARSKGSTSVQVAPLTKENLQKLYDTFSTVDEIKSLTQVKECVGINPRKTEFYAVFKGIKEFEKTFQPTYIQVDKEEVEEKEMVKQFVSGVYNKAAKEVKGADPVVLIIDEINRGNVSSIFGELITLIEESKRLGNKEALTVTLPYSKETFGVPNNLHIIGTMNTADRSVEALDTALRRRFSFEEMMPQPQLINEIETEREQEIVDLDLAKILGVINQRIEVLIDRDHTIGHSYFLQVKSLEDLTNAFKNSIVPLLQEYFYNDYGKIGLILGQGFVQKKKENTPFANFYGIEKEEFTADIYELIDFDDINIVDAIQKLMNQKVD